MKKKYAIATITDESFLTGTMVMIHSVLKHNPWYEGDFVIIGNNITEQCNELKKKYPQIVGWQVDDRLLNLIKIFSHYRQDYSLGLLNQFFSLEVFRMTDYDQVLYIDSDIICMRDLRPMLEFDQSKLIATYDFTSYRGQKRDLTTYNAQWPDDEIDGLTYIKTFSCGVLLVNKPFLSEKVYLDLLKMLNPIRYEHINNFQTDQYILNLYFQNKYLIVPCHYNYILHGREVLTKDKGVPFEEAVLLHFSKCTNPWEEGIDMALPWYELWHKYHDSFLKSD